MFTQMFTHQEGGWGRPENLSLPGQSAGRSATPNTTQSGGKMVSGAHMSRIGNLGFVHADDVIGYHRTRAIRRACSTIISSVTRT